MDTHLTDLDSLLRPEIPEVVRGRPAVAAVEFGHVDHPIVVGLGLPDVVVVDGVGADSIVFVVVVLVNIVLVVDVLHILVVVVVVLLVVHDILVVVLNDIVVVVVVVVGSLLLLVLGKLTGTAGG